MIIQVHAVIHYTDGSKEPEYMHQQSSMGFMLNPIKANCIDEDGNVCSIALGQYVWDLVDPFNLYDSVEVTYKFAGTLTPAGPF